MVNKLKRVFIANRGEIARRIAATAHKLGIETACIGIKDKKPHFLHGLIDHWVDVAVEDTTVYLNQNLMLKYAMQANCDCLHPGFGFLSENAGFAESVSKSGLIWIGPNHSSIELMASKAKAREIALNCGVPCTSGLSNIKVDQPDFQKTIDQFKASARFPVIVKAAFGGGGKGMRLVYDPDELEHACQRAASEALNSFGDSSLMIEQYIESARHVEVQVLGDKKGQIAIIGDRDCSVQRRHQKILEEAPAPFLSDKTRKALHKTSTDLAKQVNYVSAGTVEFLVEWTEHQDQIPDDPNVYFLEMNTRLQVEHPVTEEVFGIDLVAWQFKIAAGQELDQNLFHLTPRGHAIEARIYAEDCENNFLPSPEKVFTFAPGHTASSRWEVGLDPCDQVSASFDPMVGKAIAKGSDRASSIQNLSEQLCQSIFFGPKNNIAYLVEILTNTHFKDEVVSTHFIGNNHEHILRNLDVKKQSIAIEVEKGNIKPPQSKALTASQAKVLEAYQTPSHKNLKYQFSKYGSYRSELAQSEWGAVLPGFYGSSIHWARGYLQGKPFCGVSIKGLAFLEVKNSLSGAQTKSAEEEPGSIKAPVPGKVISVAKQSGESVSVKETLVILESMKMEFQVKSPSTGIIDQIKVQVGEQVQTGQLLASVQDQSE